MWLIAAANCFHNICIVKIALEICVLNSFPQQKPHLRRLTFSSFQNFKEVKPVWKKSIRHVWQTFPTLSTSDATVWRVRLCGLATSTASATIRPRSSSRNVSYWEYPKNYSHKMWSLCRKIVWCALISRLSTKRPVECKKVLYPKRR